MTPRLMNKKGSRYLVQFQALTHQHGFLRSALSTFLELGEGKGLLLLELLLKGL